VDSKDYYLYVLRHKRQVAAFLVGSDTPRILSSSALLLTVSARRQSRSAIECIQCSFFERCL